MVKVILLGSQQTQWQIGNRFVCGGISVELTEEEIKNHKDVVASVEGVEQEKVIVEKPKKIKKEKVK
jgi:hypothetical protein